MWVHLVFSCQFTISSDHISIGIREVFQLSPDLAAGTKRRPCVRAPSFVFNVCLSVSLCFCVLCVYGCVCTSAFVSVSICLSISVCVFVFVCVCMCLCVCVSLCVCACVCVCVLVLYNERTLLCLQRKQVARMIPVGQAFMYALLLLSYMSYFFHICLTTSFI